jgi:hypothetical protein
MNDASANPSPLKTAEIKSQPESWLAEPKPDGEGWPWRKLFFFIVLAVIAHIGLVCFFGTKKQIVPRTVSKVPQLQLADSDNDLIALGNPTLFALPNSRDFSSAIWLKIPAVTSPSFRWTEPPQWLPLTAENLGATFRQFMQTNEIAALQLDMKPPPEFSAPPAPDVAALPQNSTLKFFGALARRTLLQPIVLPSLAYNNVIPPSKVQVLVDMTGKIVSAVLLTDNNGAEATEHFNDADQRALEFARRLRFAPAAQLTLGEIIFIWHTVPATSTNAPASQ